MLRSPAHNQFGDTEVGLLDRQKLISSAKLSHLWPLSGTGGVKAILYGEFYKDQTSRRGSRLSCAPLAGATHTRVLPVIHRRLLRQVSSLTVGRCSPTQATSTRPSLTTS